VHSPGKVPVAIKRPKPHHPRKKNRETARRIA